MGIEVEPPVDHVHRFSLASQHRLQSIDASLRHSLQPRIYIDSPIWLRQQQQSLKNSHLVPKCGIITPCLNNIHQTVAAVASVPTDIGRDMWNIMEASSGAELEDVTFEYPIERSSHTPPTPASQLQRRSSSLELCKDATYSYNNCNYGNSPNESELDEVFLPTMQNSSGSNSAESIRTNSRLVSVRKSEIIARTMREKLRSDDTDYQSQMLSNQRALTDSSYSDYDIQKQSADHTPPANGRLLKTALQRRASQIDDASLVRVSCANDGDIKRTHDADGGVGGIGSYSRSTSSLSGLSCAGVYVVESDISPLSPRRKRKFKKSQRLTMNFGKVAGVSNKTMGTCKNNGSSLGNESGSAPTKEMADGFKTTVTSGNKHCNATSNGNITPKMHSSNNNSNNSNNNCNNNNNNSNLHRHATERQAQQQPHTIHCLGHDKFSRLRAVSHLIFPPIVKHSSLFQLFQPSVSSMENATTHNNSTTTTSVAADEMSQASIATATTTCTTTTAIAKTTPHAISSNVVTTASQCLPMAFNEDTPQTTAVFRATSIDESIKTKITDITDPTPTPQSKAQPPPPTINTRLS